MNKPLFKIGFDLDDTLNNSAINEYIMYAEKFCKEKNLPFNPDNTKWYMDERMNWDQQTYMKFVFKYIESIDFQSHIPLANIHALHRLKSHRMFDCEIVIVTARDHTFYNNTHYRTHKYLKSKEVPFDTLVTHATDKAKVCNELNLFAFFDDSSKHYQNIEQNTQTLSVLKQQPYNQDFIDCNNCLNLKSVDCFIDLIEQEILKQIKQQKSA